MAEGRKKITEEKRGRKATRSKEKNGRNGRRKKYKMKAGRKRMKK